MRIIIDAMSGDKAPGEIVRGAILAQREYAVDIVLVGQEQTVRAILAENGANGENRISVVNATEIVDMHDDPSTAVRHKKDSSMAVSLALLRDGGGDAVISAGNTGALLSGATLVIKRIRGIRRAAMAPVLPNGNKGALLIDCGANVDCTPEYLLQFAFMGSFYSRSVLGCAHPRVALLNIGTEDTKGGELQKAAYALLKEAGEAGRVNFIGNVESSDVFSGSADVIVADGYSGNILLKTIEGTAKFMLGHMKAVLTSSKKAKLGAALVRDDLRALKKLMDPGEVGGTPFLGVKQPVFKAHGSSDAKAICSAVRQAISFVEAGVTAEIERNIEYMKLKPTQGGTDNERV